MLPPSSLVYSGDVFFKRIRQAQAFGCTFLRLGRRKGAERRLQSSIADMEGLTAKAWSLEISPIMLVLDPDPDEGQRSNIGFI